MPHPNPRYIVRRRTFEAKKFPKSSPERSRLNEDAVTSEYYPSQKYQVYDTQAPTNIRAFSTFRTKREAEFDAEVKNRAWDREMMEKNRAFREAEEEVKRSAMERS